MCTVSFPAAVRAWTPAMPWARGCSPLALGYLRRAVALSWLSDHGTERDEIS